ncbi:hypothetical protein WAI453_011676 [Rhynchosporium graminicola]|uniref:2EXR domain-containing protein n=1 Tax=Rhynchosporium graminicola TaxID=2792576 RepID=A0A1E1JZX7_9HELO|nr:uncharacterized protein RCO7_07099 [Rhynchosporium commune]
MESNVLPSLYPPPMSPPKNPRIKQVMAQLPSLNIPQPSVPLHEFTSFSYLPDHLRARIWHFAASETRYIKLIALDYRVPASYQKWDSRVSDQPRAPGILLACWESRRVGSLHYKRIFEKAQQLSENKDLRWRGTNEELIEAKRAAQLTNSNIIYVNFSRDIFVHVRCPAIAHEQGAEHIHNYNFKPFFLQCVERIQQIYSENNGMPFPIQLFAMSRIWDYGFELGEDSKEVIKGLTGVERDVHMYQLRLCVITGLFHFLGGVHLKVLLWEWNVELR